MQPLKLTDNQLIFLKIEQKPQYISEWEEKQLTK